MTNTNVFPNINANEKWSVPPPLHTNGSAGGSVKSLLAPTTISSKMKATLSVQTVQNVTFLLNNLLQQYDNSLRPDLGGKIRNIRTPYVEYIGIYCTILHYIYYKPLSRYHIALYQSLENANKLKNMHFVQLLSKTKRELVKVIDTIQTCGASQIGLYFYKNVLHTIYGFVNSTQGR